MTQNAILPKNRAPNTLSVCMIVKDEENHLGDCLKSVQSFADQIVVVDTGSTDGTVKIADSYGATVVQSDWRNDFSYSRNISLDHATSRWILWLDADDRVPPAEVEKFKKLKTAPPDRAFYMKIRNVRPGGFGEQWFQLRMFPNHPKVRFERKVHEQIGFAVKRLGLTIFKVDVRIDHVGYEHPEMHRKKALRNREILLTDLSHYRDDPTYVSSLGDSYFITEEFDEAIKWYKEVLNIPQSQHKQPDIYRQIPTSIALSYQRMDDFPNALDWVEKSLATQPEKLDSMFIGAEIKEKMGDLLGAIEFYERIVQAPRIHTTYATNHEGLKAKALVCLGKIYKELNRTDQAERVYRSCMKKYPSVLNAYSELGELLLKQGKFQEAIELFNRSLEFFRGGDIKTYLGLARGLISMGKFQEAVKVLEEGRQFFPNQLAGKTINQTGKIGTI